MSGRSSKHICTKQLDTFLSNEKINLDNVDNILLEEKSSHFHIQLLTDDILIKIFNFFSIFEQMEVLAFVCMKWKQLINEMEKVAFFDSTRENHILHFLNKTENIVAIKLQQIPDDVSLILKKIRMIQKNLKYLEINDCKIGKMKNSIFVYSKRLNKLFIDLSDVIEVISLKNCEFLTNSLLVTFSKMKNLRALTIGGNSMLQSRDIIALLINCESLTDFGLYSIENLTDSDIKFMFCNKRVINRLKSINLDKVFNLNSIAYEYLLHCKYLEKFHIDFSTSITSEIFFLIKLKLLRLKSLKLCNICTLSSDDIERFFNENTTIYLQEFIFRDCATNLTDTALIAIAENLNNTLVKLTLKNCTRLTCLRTLFENCHHLRMLNLSGCKNINIDNFNVFAKTLENGENILIPKYLERMEHLILPHHLYNPLLFNLPFLTQFYMEYKKIDDFDKIMEKFKRL